MPTKTPSATRLPAPFQLDLSFSSRSLITWQPKTWGAIPFLSPKSGTRPQCRCMRVTVAWASPALPPPCYPRAGAWLGHGRLRLTWRYRLENGRLRCFRGYLCAGWALAIRVAALAAKEPGTCIGVGIIPDMPDQMCCMRIES